MAGDHILETNSEPNLQIKSTDSSYVSATPCFCQLLSSSAIYHFDPKLGSVGGGNMSGRQDGDAGRSYLETQQALVLISGEID